VIKNLISISKVITRGAGRRAEIRAADREDALGRAPRRLVVYLVVLLAGVRAVVPAGVVRVQQRDRVGIGVCSAGVVDFARGAVHVALLLRADVQQAIDVTACVVDHVVVLGLAHGAVPVGNVPVVAVTERVVRLAGAGRVGGLRLIALNGERRGLRLGVVGALVGGLDLTDERLDLRGARVVVIIVPVEREQRDHEGGDQAERHDECQPAAIKSPRRRGRRDERPYAGHPIPRVETVVHPEVSVGEVEVDVVVHAVPENRLDVHHEHSSWTSR
jgi:hypothetical protein